ncbi:hypothetical protein [Tunturiibacter psychrotolerans]|uniref:hypothetical protein n=1 Tax=Tunturiibacter psychrotolerans TaxID=3069686 RepID=UPI003D241D0C
MKWPLRAVVLGSRLVRTCLIALMIASAVWCSTLFAQNPSVQEPTDLKVELRSSTGTNRFQLGEVIPVQVLISSSTPDRYLEPCTMFWESCFGYPRCRFQAHWSFDISPGTGWTDIGWHGCSSMSGPTFEVKSSDLTMEPKQYPYTLTKRFRFNTPGRYTVRLSLTVGLDDETNQLRTPETTAAKHDSVSKTAEMVLEIVPASDAWEHTVLQQGLAAWTATPPRYTNPPSPEYLKYQQEKDAFCNLGTSEAAIAFVNLLSKGIDTRDCLEINANKEAAETEMRRLLVDPNVAVRAIYFAEYAKLLSKHEGKPALPPAVLPKVVNEVRDTLFSSLPKKAPDAEIVSFETVLRNPMSGYWVVPGSAYDLRELYAPNIIAMVAAVYDRLSQETREALLDSEWDHVRSPLMLPVVRREAERGDGHALLRWQELDHAAATAFMRVEVLRPAPRFSSLFIRLPDESLPGQEHQMATNFAALRDPQQLIAEATLLHRYATRATLPALLPFIDQHLAAWPCEVQIPVLAYLLKVSPNDARTSLEQVLKTVRPLYCPRGEFLPSLGYMQTGPVLDILAAKQVEDGTPLSDDAAEYLRRDGSASMKPVVWEQLSRWHKKYAESGAELRMGNGTGTQDDHWLYTLDSRLREAYVNAHGWTLSPEDVRKLSELLGAKKTEGLACTFSCSSQLSVGPEPGNYYVYGRVSDPIYPPQSRIDYLMPTEPFVYQVNQYGCRDLKNLEQKLLQFPAGSKFSFAHTGSGRDVGDWAAISAFLHSHGYVAGN